MTPNVFGKEEKKMEKRERKKRKEKKKTYSHNADEENHQKKGIICPPYSYCV